MMKSKIVKIEGVRCTVFTEFRSVRVGHDARATRKRHITILSNGCEIATASTLSTAMDRARKNLAS